MRVAALVMMAVLGTTAGLAAVPGESRAVIAGGDFTPTLSPAPGQTQVHVKAFGIDRRPVTNQEYLRFVQRHPQWRRDAVVPLFADHEYLSHWVAPDRLGPQAGAHQPVTRVSWFAARAYCEDAGGRLPDWAEWELVAAADQHRVDARHTSAWQTHILDWYARPASEALPSVGMQAANAYGVQDLHGLIWEWVEDFGSLLVSGDSRMQGDPDRLAFCGAGAVSAQVRENYPILMRVAYLSALEARSTTRSLGFRCAAKGP